ncbi:sarcosine oxidase subunit delta [Mesorhizobium xinjiangense]|uniref:sarcosine oxidase subunit delta n=1 Tax=Mesorhizobium xinjiangense TaxID=2678685 RepID=UPI0012EDE445|nr:sarcosine oxidase subunit delta [Mesorhizobium xinjiangense]
MLINCPYCGPRDLSEFTYRGDANRTRPADTSTDQAAWNAYVYERVNTAGDHPEYWQHSGGCRSHILVMRSTLTHEIASVSLARGQKKASARRQQKKRPARRRQEDRT